MNALFGASQPYCTQEKEEIEDGQTFGEVFAASFVSLLVAAILIISTWSAVLFISGNTSNGGPVGFLFHLIHTGVEALS